MASSFAVFEDAIRVKSMHIQGDHLSGKPGNVRKFETCQGNVREFANSQGIVSE